MIIIIGVRPLSSATYDTFCLVYVIYYGCIKANIVCTFKKDHRRHFPHHNRSLQLAKFRAVGSLRQGTAKYDHAKGPKWL